MSIYEKKSAISKNKNKTKKQKKKRKRKKKTMQNKEWKTFSRSARTIIIIYILYIQPILFSSNYKIRQCDFYIFLSASQYTDI